MRIIILGMLVCGIVAFSPVRAVAVGLPPWRFGMTKEEVQSFRQFGPYKTFPNGDLETFNKVFHGGKENVQFFFANNRLIKIGVYLADGVDRGKALSVSDRAYSILQQSYGELESPDVKAPGSGPINRRIFLSLVVAYAATTGRGHIGPVKMPKDEKVWLSVMRAPGPAESFSVAIMFSPP